MKILEVINEASTPTLKLVSGAWSWILPDGTVLGSFSSMKDAQDWAKANPASLNPTAAPTTPTRKRSKFNEIFTKFRRLHGKPGAKAIGSKVADFFFKRESALTKGGYVDYAKAKLPGRITGAYLRVVQVLNYTEFFVDYFAAKKFYEDNAKSQENPDGFDEEELKSLKDHELGILLGKIAISQGLAWVISSGKLIRWIFRIVGLAGALETMGISLVLVFTAEVAQMFVMNWLNSKEGKEALAAFFIRKILDKEVDFAEMAGSIFTTAGDKIIEVVTRAVKMAAGAEPTKVTPANTDQQPDQKPNQNTDQQPDQSQNSKPKPSSKPGQGGQNPSTGKKSSSEEDGEYSRYTDDPELKAALKRQGL